MKNLILIINLSFLLVFFSCSEKVDSIEPTNNIEFLNNIRPIYFESLNFESKQVVDELSSFLSEFKEEFDVVENQYNSGLYTTEEDLKNVSLMYNYYSFYLMALVRAELDGLIAFDKIVEGRKDDFFSKLTPNDIKFKSEELAAMIQKAESISYKSVFINGYNDKTFGFYLAIRQLNERVKNNGYNNKVTQDSIINYSLDKIYDYDIFYLWNILMSQLTYNNYSDSLNTFENPSMEKVLHLLNSKLIPGVFTGETNNYAPFLGSIYRLDMNMKKIDFIIQKGASLDEEAIEDLRKYIFNLDITSNFVETKHAKRLESWDLKNSYAERKEKIKEIKNYYDNMVSDNIDYPKPKLSPLFTSKSFNQAYQCYTCHKSPN